MVDRDLFQMIGVDDVRVMYADKGARQGQLQVLHPLVCHGVPERALYSYVFFLRLNVKNILIDYPNVLLARLDEYIVGRTDII